MHDLLFSTLGISNDCPVVAILEDPLFNSEQYYMQGIESN